MFRVDLNEAQARLPELIVSAVPGEVIIITRDDTPIAKLVRLESSGTPQFGNARGKIEMADDFDAPLEDFREYME
jgi:antitoxin (DNA-binding transcriptional repressor) of toxin-antitoxin stability system